MSDPRLLNDAALMACLFPLSTGAAEDGRREQLVRALGNHIDALQERADALHEQREDLQSIIARQEEELEQARLREVALELRVERLKAGRIAHIVFDGPPSHESGRFVEVEDENGCGLNAGLWLERKDGYWALVVTLAALDDTPKRSLLEREGAAPGSKGEGS